MHRQRLAKHFEFIAGQSASLSRVLSVSSAVTAVLCFVERLAGWCSENDLELNVSKTKEMVFDFRKKNTPLVPLTIAGEVVEEVRSFKFLGTTISSDLKWDENFSSAIKKAHQRLYLLSEILTLSTSVYVRSRERWGMHAGA